MIVLGFSALGCF